MLSIHSNPVKEDTKWSDDDDDDDEDKDEDNAYAEVDAIAKNDDRSARFTSTEDEEKEEAEAAQMAKSSRKVGRIHHVNPDGTGSVGESARFFNSQACVRYGIVVPGQLVHCSAPFEVFISVVQNGKQSPSAFHKMKFFRWYEARGSFIHYIFTVTNADSFPIYVVFGTSLGSHALLKFTIF